MALHPYRRPGVTRSTETVRRLRITYRQNDRQTNATEIVFKPRTQLSVQIHRDPGSTVIPIEINNDRYQ